MKICFLLPGLALAGGIGVILEHAQQLSKAHGMDVTLVLTTAQVPGWDYRHLDELSVMSLEEATETSFDVAIATAWETAYDLLDLSAERYAYFVQSLEDRFMPPEDPAKRLAAAATLSLPVAFITEARWIADLISELRPEARCYYVRNGIAKDVFVSPTEVEPRTSGPLRVLVEGDPDIWFKGVGEAAATLREVTEPYCATFVTRGKEHPAVGDIPARYVGPLSQAELAALYAETDVVLKLSRVEGMFGPPLEGFHMGATCVVAPVTGHEEYVVHGWNGVVCDWDDFRGTGRWLDLLARNRRFLHFLRSNALLTAKGWPSWEQAGQLMAPALKTIRRLPPPPARAGWGRLMADLWAGTEELHSFSKQMQTARNTWWQRAARAEAELARRAEQHE